MCCVCPRLWKKERSVTGRHFAGRGDRLVRDLLGRNGEGKCLHTSDVGGHFTGFRLSSSRCSSIVGAFARRKVRIIIRKSRPRSVFTRSIVLSRRSRGGRTSTRCNSPSSLVACVQRVRRCPALAGSRIGSLMGHVSRKSTTTERCLVGYGLGCTFSITVGCTHGSLPIRSLVRRTGVNLVITASHCGPDGKAAFSSCYVF